MWMNEMSIQYQDAELFIFRAQSTYLCNYTVETPTGVNPCPGAHLEPPPPQKRGIIIINCYFLYIKRITTNLFHDFSLAHNGMVSTA